MSAPSAEYIGYRLEAFVAAIIVLDVIAVGLRFWARAITVKSFDAGDWLVGAALVGQFVAGGIAVGTVRHAGVGHHADYVAEANPETITTFFKYLVAMSTWYATTESLSKLAICILYKRIFHQKHMQIIINVTMGVLICASIACGLADLFGCTPFSAHWGSAEEQAKYCINIEALFVWGSFPNIVTDVVLMILPIPTIWNLHTTMGMKVGLLISFLFGSIGLITSVLRFTAFNNKSSFVDPTFSAVELIIWTVCEPGVYLISACLLVYRPLIDKLGIRMFPGATRRGTSAVKSGSHHKIPKAGLDSSLKQASVWTVGRGDSQTDDLDESPLKHTAGGIAATTDIEMVWEPHRPGQVKADGNDWEH